MKFSHLIAFLSTLLLLLAGASSCSKKDCANTEKIKLLVSIAPYQTIVQRIAGDEFEIVTVVPPNVNPHTYEPTSKQAASLQNGAVWFQIGEPFEKKLHYLLRTTRNVDLRASASMIETQAHHCEGCGQDHLDRHIWLSPRQTALQAEQIGAVLQEMYPTQADAIALRLAQLQADLIELDEEITTRIQDVPARTFLVSHPAFAYFCRDYGLQQLAVEHEGKDPRPKDLEIIFQSALRQQTEVAIALPQHNNKGAQLIAEKLRIPIRIIDPYSAQYFETIRALANLIANPYQNDE